MTNAGGPGILATDMLVGEGGEIARLSDESFRKLDEDFDRITSAPVGGQNLV